MLLLLTTTALSEALIAHPGYESFDGEIARFLIWERPLTDEELVDTMALLRGAYRMK